MGHQRLRLRLRLLLLLLLHVQVEVVLILLLRLRLQLLLVLEMRMKFCGSGLRRTRTRSSTGWLRSHQVALRLRQLRGVRFGPGGLGEGFHVTDLVVLNQIRPPSITAGGPACR